MPSLEELGVSLKKLGVIVKEMPDTWHQVSAATLRALKSIDKANLSRESNKRFGKTYFEKRKWIIRKSHQTRPTGDRMGTAQKVTRRLTKL